VSAGNAIPTAAPKLASSGAGPERQLVRRGGEGPEVRDTEEFGEHRAVGTASNPKLDDIVAFDLATDLEAAHPLLVAHTAHLDRYPGVVSRHGLVGGRRVGNVEVKVNLGVD